MISLLLQGMERWWLRAWIAAPMCGLPKTATLELGRDERPLGLADNSLLPDFVREPV